jgi:hypothetical protein
VIEEEGFLDQQHPLPNNDDQSPYGTLNMKTSERNPLLFNTEYGTMEKDESSPLLMQQTLEQKPAGAALNSLVTKVA